MSIPIALASPVIPIAVVSAQSADHIQLPNDWAIFETRVDYVLFRSSESQGMAGYFTEPPEQAAKSMLIGLGIPQDTIVVQSEDGLTLALAKIKASKTSENLTLFAMTRAARDGRTALVFHVLRGAPDDVVLKMSSASLPVLHRLAGITGPVSDQRQASNEGDERPAPKNLAYSGPLKPVAKAPADLVGYWRGDGVRNEYRYPSGLTIVAIHDDYVFTPGGYFISGAPSGVGFGDKGALAMMAEEPGRAGIFVVKPSQIELRYANGKIETLNYRKHGQAYSIQAGIAGVGYMGQKTIAPDGYKLNGVWVNSRITDTGAGFVSGASYIHFTASGQFLYSNSVSFSGAAMTSIQRDPSIGGTYSIADGAITLRYANGREEVMSIFWETSPSSAMWLNGSMYQPAG